MLLSNLTLLYEIILRNYFVNDVIHSRCLLIFTENHFHYGNDVEIPIILIKIRESSVNWDLVFNNYGCQSIVLHVENPAELISDIETRIRLNLERLNYRRYLILPRFENEDNAAEEIPKINQNFKEIFKMHSLDHIADLLVVNPETNLIFNLETHKFVGDDANKNQKISIDKWFSTNSSFLKNGSNLYPEKIENQQGRTFTMATLPYPPYSVPRNDGEFYGSEMKTITEFARKLNVTPILIVTDLWGNIFDNGTSIGVLGIVNNQSADVGFGALYTWEYCYKYLDLSKPIVRTGITCLVPGPDLAAGWLTPLLSFNKEIWVGVGLVFLLGITTLGFSQYFYKISKSSKPSKTRAMWEYFASSIMTIWKPFLMQSLTFGEIPKSEFHSKLIIALILIFSLFLTSSYSSGFSSIMTVPRYVAIDSVHDLADSGMEWGATEDAWTMSIKNAQEPNYIKIVNKFKVMSSDELSRSSFGREMAFSIERLPYDNFAIGEYIRGDVIDDFHLMSQDLYWEYCVFMLRKSSIFLPDLDLFILRVMQSGLSSIWQNEAVVKFMQGDVQRAVKFYRHRASEHKVVKLRWLHVEGAFAILMIGNGLGLIVFSIELLCGRLSKLF